ncbi:ABC transporter permease [Brevibacillus massiliensis]|jgi:putative ABC transport system permease protein
MKLRTALTSVGVMIGTAAIVAMISLSLGLKENAVKSLENWGSLTEMEVAPSYMMPDQKTMRPPDQIKKLNSTAVQELKQVPGVSAVMPTKQLYTDVTLKLGRREANLQLVGVDVQESKNYKKEEVEKGTYLEGPKNEIVVTYEVPRQMRDVEKERREARKRGANNESSGGRGFFPGPGGGEGEGQTVVDMVGKSATLVLTREYYIDNEPKFERKEVRVRVVGQLKKEDRGRWWGGNTAYVPMSLINELNEWVNQDGGRGSWGMYGDDEGTTRIKDRNQKKEIEYDTITVKVASREQVEDTVKRIQNIGYEIYSPAGALEQINQFFFVVQMILGGIAAISLLVASIGIVNTMIMSILERTKEIGIMKVIGASVYNIRWLFLMESGFIGLFGGFAGLGIAFGAVELLNYLGQNSDFLNQFGGGGPMPDSGPTKLAIIPLWLSGFAIGFSFLIGLMAGIFPAFRASRLSPMQAIRSE